VIQIILRLISILLTKRFKVVTEQTTNLETDKEVIKCN